MDSAPQDRTKDLDRREATPAAAYRHHRYVESFTEHGEPLHLPGADGWLLVRPIPGTPHYDAMGCYPLFCCADWSRLPCDLAAIGPDLVSVVLVTDPLGDFEAAELSRYFDIVRRFKEHYVVDLTRPLEENVSKSNRATARRALRNLDVRLLEEPTASIDDWWRLFRDMVRRQDLSGLRNYSRACFLEQLKTPGAMMFEARAAGEVVGLDMIFVDGDRAYGHACAFNEEGYRLRASYATRWHMLEHLQGRVRYLDFGGTVGARHSTEGDSLADYKKRWCAMTRPVYLCTSVFNRALYDELCEGTQGARGSGYFPAYRNGEFR